MIVMVTAWPCTEERITCLSECLDSLAMLQGPPMSRLVSAETEGVHSAARAHVEHLCDARGWALDWRYAPANIGLHLDDVYATLPEGQIVYVQEDFILTKPLDITAACAALREFTMVQMAPAFSVPSGITPLPIGKPRFSHRPYAANIEWWRRLGPLGPGKGERGRGQEAQMAEKWAHEPVGVMGGEHFVHIGKHSLVRPGKVWE